MNHLGDVMKNKQLKDMTEFHQMNPLSDQKL